MIYNHSCFCLSWRCGL